MSRRPGYSLIEILFAAAILAVVLGGLMQGFMGTRRAQGAAVSQSSLKVAGQQAIKRMYIDLSQSRKLLASTTIDPAAKDLGREYFLRFDGRNARAIPTGNLQFPRVDVDGGLGLAGSGSGELETGTVGNTLVLVTTGPEYRLATNLVGYLQGGTSLKAMSSVPYVLPSVRFVAYYLIDRTLPPDVTVGGRTATQQLVRWESKPYIEKGEVDALLDKLVLKPASTLLVAADLNGRSEPPAGVWDAASATAANALYKIDATGALVKSPSTDMIQRRREALAADTGLEPYATGMVAFNTDSTFSVQDGDRPMPVPAFAKLDAAHVNFPYGFETAIVGPSGARSVLVRLALAAQLNQGRHLFGVAQQEVVKVFDL